MFDIHHHLLFGLDDGPSDLEMSCAMVDAAIADGITHVACTPHANDRWGFTPEINRERLAAIEGYAAGRITLGLGCDFHLTYDNIQDQLQNPSKYTINGLRYLLVEFPDYGIQPAIGETLYDFVAAGVIPIITHPERNATLQTRPGMMADWIQNGCLVQVTAGSLLGRFGPKAEAVSRLLLKQNLVHFLASDAHNITTRPPNLGEGHKALVKDYGREVADRLCIHNPRAIFYGEPLPPLPDTSAVEELPGSKGKGFISRMFSR